jgi:hypothetical protein
MDSLGFERDDGVFERGIDGFGSTGVGRRCLVLEWDVGVVEIERRRAVEFGSAGDAHVMVFDGIGIVERGDAGLGTVMADGDIRIAGSRRPVYRLARKGNLTKGVKSIPNRQRGVTLHLHPRVWLVDLQIVDPM